MDSLSTKSLVAATVTLALIALIRKVITIRNKYSFFQRQGIKNPKPWFALGNLLDLILTNHRDLDKKWTREFGKVYGVFFGTSPNLVIADPEVIMQICIKDFDAFVNLGAGELANDMQRRFLFNLNDDDWRRVRSLMSPAFTSGKIRRMYQMLESCAKDLEQNLIEKITKEGAGFNEVTINAKDLFSLFTMDAISTCCYGLKIKRTGLMDMKKASAKDDVVKMCMDAFKINLPSAMAFFVFPKFLLDWFKIEACPMKYTKPLASRMNSVIKKRRLSTASFDDYLQSIIDARIDPTTDRPEGSSEVSENPEEGAGNEKKPLWSRRLTDDEIVSQAILIMVAGFETTGSLLTHCVHSLAFHQDIQQRLFEELRSVGQYDEQAGNYTFDYETLASNHYLEAVLSETARRMPVFSWTNRTASRDYHFEKYNVTVEKGSVVRIACSSVMNDPDYWDEPEKFNPDRFMPENAGKIVPGSFCPFGTGPRMCLGMRFAQLESKIAIAKLVTSFHFTPTPGSVFDGELIPKFFMSILKNSNVNVKIRQ